MNLKRAVDCDSSIIRNASNIIAQETSYILPNVQSDRISVGPTTNDAASCAIVLTINNNKGNGNDNLMIIPIIAGVFGAVIITFVALLIFNRVRQRVAYIKQLPRDVRWSFEEAASDILHLTWKKSGEYSFYSRRLDSNSQDFMIVRNLFVNNLYGDGIKIISITSIYNETLVNGFIGDYIKWTRRLKDNQQLFQKSDWKDHIELRNWVMEKFQKRVVSFSWNLNALVPIIPVCHGTDELKSYKICNGGFASLNTLDAGFFGKGIYMTSYAEYALRYAAGHHPAIIIAYIIPGHPYPVIEDHRYDGTLLGSALKPGCQSHYVRTNCIGNVLSIPDDTSYDEIVLAQENLVVPAFILTVDVQDIINLQKKIEKSFRRFFC